MLNACAAGVAVVNIDNGFGAGYMAAVINRQSGRASSVRLAYLDCFSGISGDMVLGAMLDAGLPLDELCGALAGLPLGGFTLCAEKVTRAGIAATHAVVDVSEEQPARTLDDILRDHRRGPPAGRGQGAVVRGVPAARGGRGSRPRRDSGRRATCTTSGRWTPSSTSWASVAGLRMLGAGALYCSALPLGEGEVRGPHGTLPVPAPATLALVADAKAPVREGGAAGELVTPTGAALVTTLAAFRGRR